jgi:hypothetical protein
MRTKTDHFDLGTCPIVPKKDGLLLER